MTRVGLAAVACAIAAIGCGRPSPPPATIQVLIQQVAFQQPEVHAHVGDTIEWVNKDLFTHTATSRQPGWDVSMEPGMSGRAVMNRAGSFEYYCRLHPNMTGRISVDR